MSQAWKEKFLGLTRERKGAEKRGKRKGAGRNEWPSRIIEAKFLANVAAFSVATQKIKGGMRPSRHPDPRNCLAHYS